MNKLTTEVSHQELMSAWAPLVDVSMMLDRIKGKAGGNAGDMFGFMDDKVKWALEPLEKLIDRIEKENPDDFS